jgi:DnaJ-class molecular chaperone
VIREGYKILSDPEKRVMYDAKLHATEHGITLMFFPKDTKAVKKLGVNTVIFAVLACVFTYLVYQKLLVREAAPVSVEQAKAEKQNPQAQSKAAPPVAPAANPPDAKAIAKPDEK